MRATSHSPAPICKIILKASSAVSSINLGVDTHICKLRDTLAARFYRFNVFLKKNVQTRQL